MGFELVIFDCDGVLVDSEPAANRALAALLTEIGLPTSYEQSLRAYKGRSWASCVSLIEEELGRALPGRFEQRYRSELFSAFERELEPVPGVVAALTAIPIPRCVASSADHERLRKALHTTCLLPYFEGRIFSATDVERGKPEPDLFVHAARSLGASPERCAVIEDSAPGVAAARAARMTPFGFAGTSTADEAELEAEGARLFRHMRELPELLASAGDELSARSPVSSC